MHETEILRVKLSPDVTEERGDVRDLCEDGLDFESGREEPNDA
jgi:hypothetical protein